MDPILYISLAVLVVLFAGLVYFLYSSRTSGSQPVPGDEGADEVRRRGVRGAEVPVVRGGRRRAVGATGPPRHRLAQRAAPGDDDDDNEDEDVAESATLLPGEKVGAKKQRKLEEKAARKAQREAEQQEREERKKQEEKQEQLRKKEEERQEAQQAAKELEEKRLREEQEQREHEEYLKLKAEFSVEEEGTDAVNDQDMQSLLQEFISYIKKMKVVMLEDLAAHFKIRTQDAIDRIKTLQEDGTLSGVIDDRGKFVYITAEEYESVAKFIKQRGRVSITDLAESMNRLINLNPDNAHLATQMPSHLNGESSIDTTRAVVC